MNKGVAVVVAAAITEQYDRVMATAVQMPADSEYYVVQVVNKCWGSTDTFDTTLSIQQMYPTREGWSAGMQEVKNRVKDRMTHAGTLAYRAFEG